MGRIAGIAEGIRRSGVRLGPLDAVFGGLDYVDGKASGEDDIRAGAGAVGSTLGGWGGAASGAALGATIGSVVPFVGTAIGGAVGAIAGGSAGGFAGGYGADRLDEIIRGNKKMQQFYDRNGNPVVQKDDGSWGVPDIIAGGLGLGAAGVAGKQIASNFTNPQSIYNTARMRYGATPRQATQAAIGNVGADAMRGLRSMPMGAKIAGGAALAYGANKILGNPVGGVADAMTGNNFDFDSKGRPPTQGTANYQRDQREANQAFSIPNYDMPNSPERQGQLAAERENYVNQRNWGQKLAFEREGDERLLRRNAMDYRAKQASDLVNAYANLIPNSVANQMQALGSWR